jgi:hypothetical protein
MGQEVEVFVRGPRGASGAFLSRLWLPFGEEDAAEVGGDYAAVVSQGRGSSVRTRDSDSEERRRRGTHFHACLLWCAVRPSTAPSRDFALCLSTCLNTRTYSWLDHCLPRADGTGSGSGYGGGEEGEDEDIVREVGVLRRREGK